MRRKSGLLLGGVVFAAMNFAALMMDSSKAVRSMLP